MKQERSEEEQALRDACHSNIVKNRAIAAVLQSSLDWLSGCAPQPKGDERLSRAMSCETNGAEHCLESLLNAAKAFSPGKVPREPIDLLQASSLELLDRFCALAKSVPVEFSDLAEKLQRSITHAKTALLELFNLIRGSSGAGRDCSVDTRHQRLDKRLGHFKKCLGEMLEDVFCLETRIERGDCPPVIETPRKKSARRKSKKVETLDSCEVKLREDRRAVAEEIRRRIQYQYDKSGKETRKSTALKLLFEDKVWRPICRQWSYDTLYQYLRNDLAEWHPKGQRGSVPGEGVPRDKNMSRDVGINVGIKRPDVGINVGIKRPDVGIKSRNVGINVGIKRPDVGINPPDVGINPPNVGINVGIKSRDVGINVGINRPNVGIKRPDVGINVGIKRLDVGINGLSETENVVLARVLAEPTITASALAGGLKMTQRHIERVLASLKVKANLKRVGSRKTGHWLCVRE